MIYPLANDEPSITGGSGDIQFVSGCCFNTADLGDFSGIIFAEGIRQTTANLASSKVTLCLGPLR
jgi:hypothetical protein